VDFAPATLDALLHELRQLRAEVRELRAERRQGGGVLLTTEEAAAHLRLTSAALLKRVERGQIPAQRMGRRWRFRRRDLDALVGRGVTP
jgi:excisionase family DNA binding protein